MPVYVYKTNVAYAETAGAISGQLKKIPGVLRCNFDLSDVDKILRVEAITALSPVVEKTLRAAGFFCRELED
jgi:hypothetical protein